MLVVAATGMRMKTTTRRTRTIKFTTGRLVHLLQAHPPPPPPPPPPLPVDSSNSKRRKAGAYDDDDDDDDDEEDVDSDEHEDDFDDDDKAQEAVRKPLMQLLPRHGRSVFFGVSRIITGARRDTVQFWSGTRLNLDKSFKLGPVKTTYIYKVVTSDLRHAAFDDDDDDDDDDVDSDDEFEGDFDASDSDMGSLPDLVGLGSFNSSVMSLPDLVSVDNPDRDMGFYWNLLKRPSAPEP